MALTLIATAGAANANSYTTVIEANVYHEAHLYVSTWNGVTDEKKSQALVWATRLLDEHIEWEGQKSTTEQALRWPRSGMLDADGYWIDGTVIPQKLKDATAELARLLIDANLTAAGSSGGIDELKVGPITIKYAGSGSTENDTIPDSVAFMLQQWGSVRSRDGGSVALFRV